MSSSLATGDEEKSNHQEISVSGGINEQIESTSIPKMDNAGNKEVATEGEGEEDALLLKVARLRSSIRQIKENHALKVDRIAKEREVLQKNVSSFMANDSRGEKRNDSSEILHNLFHGHVRADLNTSPCLLQIEQNEHRCEQAALSLLQWEEAVKLSNSVKRSRNELESTSQDFLFNSACITHAEEEQEQDPGDQKKVIYSQENLKVAQLLGKLSSKMSTNEQQETMQQIVKAVEMLVHSTESLSARKQSLRAAISDLDRQLDHLTLPSLEWITTAVQRKMNDMVSHMCPDKAESAVFTENNKLHAEIKELQGCIAIALVLKKTDLLNHVRVTSITSENVDELEDSLKKKRQLLQSMREELLFLRKEAAENNQIEFDVSSCREINALGSRRVSEGEILSTTQLVKQNIKMLERTLTLLDDSDTSQNESANKECGNVKKSFHSLQKSIQLQQISLDALLFQLTQMWRHIDETAFYVDYLMEDSDGSKDTLKQHLIKLGIYTNNGSNDNSINTEEEAENESDGCSVRKTLLDAQQAALDTYSRRLLELQGSAEECLSRAEGEIAFPLREIRLKLGLILRLLTLGDKKQLLQLYGETIPFSTASLDKRITELGEQDIKSSTTAAVVDAIEGIMEEKNESDPPMEDEDSPEENTLLLPVLPKTNTLLMADVHGELEDTREALAREAAPILAEYQQNKEKCDRYSQIAVEEAGLRLEEAKSELKELKEQRAKQISIVELKKKLSNFEKLKVIKLKELSELKEELSQLKAREATKPPEPELSVKPAEAQPEVDSVPSAAEISDTQIKKEISPEVEAEAVVVKTEKNESPPNEEPPHISQPVKEETVENSSAQEAPQEEHPLKTETERPVLGDDDPFFAGNPFVEDEEYENEEGEYENYEDYEEDPQVDEETRRLPENNEPNSLDENVIKKENSDQPDQGQTCNEELVQEVKTEIKEEKQDDEVLDAFFGKNEFVSE